MGIKETANGIATFFWCDENILKLVVVMIATELYAFQMGEFSGMWTVSQ